MKPLNAIRRLWHRLMEEPPVSHTAIVLHWPTAVEDRTFILRGIHKGHQLDSVLDALLEEHVPATDGSQEVLTEITLFWHHADGSWEMEELLSHYYADAA